MCENITATYCPEDNKLRLYSGRVPRELYEELRAAGYKSTPKQDCDFVATWTPGREDLALSLLEDGDDIGDEDQSPEDRAADRAERFAGYREKRRAEAHGHADNYEAGPSVIGSAGTAGADRAARRQQRTAERNQRNAVSQWAKAEYWQSRTAGVIANALHKSDPDTRRGRIIRLETEQRRYAKPGGRWWDHFDRRLSYERAMLENEGGSADMVEIEPGGTYGGRLVVRVNKSQATGRAVSVVTLVDGAERRRNIQRDGAGKYEPATPEGLEALKAYKKEKSAKAKKANASKPKLINPTLEDAQRLQEALNAHHTDQHSEHKQPIQMTQAQYSARSGGDYAPCRTTELTEKLREASRYAGRGDRDGRVSVFKVRTMSAGYGARRVVVITDKPQKALPWEQVEQVRQEMPTPEKVRETFPALMAALSGSWLPNDDENAMRLIRDAQYIGWAYVSSMSQFGLTDKGHEIAREAVAETTNA